MNDFSLKKAFKKYNRFLKKKQDTNTRLADLKKKIATFFGQKSIRLNKTPVKGSKKQQRELAGILDGSKPRKGNLEKSHIFPNVKESDKLPKRRLAEEISQGRYNQYKNCKNFSTIEPREVLGNMFPEKVLSSSVQRPNIRYKLKTSQGLSMDTVYSNFGSSKLQSTSMKSREEHFNSNKFRSFNNRKSSVSSSDAKEDFAREEDQQEALPTIKNQGDIILEEPSRSSQRELRKRSRMKSHEKLTLARMIKVDVSESADCKPQVTLLKNVSNPKSFDNFHPTSIRQEYEGNYSEEKPRKPRYHSQSVKRKLRYSERGNSSPVREFSNINNSNVKADLNFKLSRYDKAKKVLKLIETRPMRYKDGRKNIIRVKTKLHKKKRKNKSHRIQPKNDENLKTMIKFNTKNSDYSDDTRDLLRYIKSQKNVNVEQEKLAKLLKKIDKVDQVNSRVKIPNKNSLPSSFPYNLTPTEERNLTKFKYQDNVNIFTEIN
ncbi:unnamed protein product [Moneuplotes crassus]|uniref:Uncharacterized protein n=1 Tax=Euplotes crassus TaxID=5936 RepID=A0AAD1XFS8_EUPCR|nr:unnamed protein product [Moneuplotes crassus]